MSMTKCDAYGKSYRSYAEAERAFNLPRFYLKLYIGRYKYSAEQAIEHYAAQLGERIEIDGIYYDSGADAARAYGITKELFNSRVRDGWTARQAAKVPTFGHMNVCGLTYRCAANLTKAFNISRNDLLDALADDETAEVAVLRLAQESADKNPVFTVNGKNYSGEAHIAVMHGLSVHVVHSRLLGNWPLEDVVKYPKNSVNTTPNSTRKYKRPVVYKDVTFKHLTELLKHYGINPVTYYKYRSEDERNGFGLAHTIDRLLDKTPKHIIDGIPYATDVELTAAYGISVALYRDRLSRGWTVEEAVKTGFRCEKGDAFKFFVDGVEYNTVPELAKAYNLETSTIYGRLYRGLSAEEAVKAEFDAAVFSRPVTVCGVPFISHAEVMRRFGVTSWWFGKPDKLDEKLLPFLFDHFGLYTDNGGVYASFESYEKESGIQDGSFKALSSRNFTPGDSENGLTFIAFCDDGAALFNFNHNFIKFFRNTA